MALCQSTSNSLQQNKSSIKNDIPESVSMQIHHNDEEYIVPPVPSSLLLSDDEDELVLKEEDEVNVKEEDEVNVKVEDQEDCESPSLFASPFAYKDLKRVETRRELCFGDVCNKSDNSCVNSEDKSVVCDGGSNQCDDEQCISTPRNLSTSTLSDFNGGILLCVYVCIYIYMYACMYVCMYICNYVCMYVCMYVYMYICMYVCMYVCRYVCICMSSINGYGLNVTLATSPCALCCALGKAGRFLKGLMLVSCEI